MLVNSRKEYLLLLNEAKKECQIEFKVKDAPVSIWKPHDSAPFDIDNEEYRIV